MNAALPLETLLRRDRLIVLAGLIGVAMIAWGYMIHEAHAMSLTGVCQCAGMKMSGPDTQEWPAATILPLFLMWGEMMVAMMIPTVAPMVLTFALVNRRRREQERPYVPTVIFLLGYLAVWAGFSAVVAVAQWYLHKAALLSPMMVSSSSALGGGVLIAAGLFQWTPVKHACLKHCRSPLDFISTEWREGAGGAFVMGLRHGAFCTVCCWFLMCLLFVTGVMNILWIALLTAFTLVERLVPRGLWLERGVGIVLVLWGGWMLAGRGF